MRRIRGIGRRGWRNLAVIAVALVGAGALGLSPVMAGKGNDSPTRYSSSLEGGGSYYEHNAAHALGNDKAQDRVRDARCAAPGYRAANPSRCLALTPKRARAERAQRARCAKPAYRRSYPALCPVRKKDVDKALKRAFQAEASTGQWSAPITIGTLPINAVLLPTGKVLWWAYPQKDTWYGAQAGLGPGDPAYPARVAQVDYAEAYVFDPATNTSVQRNPPTDPTSGLPYNLWCAGQTFLRDGRLLVAGGNLEYSSAATGFKYNGHYVVLTFNPFNETWTEQPRMNNGRWYPTLTELSDGRVVITAGLDAQNGGPGEDGNNSDIEIFTPSGDINGRGTISLLPNKRSFGLYPHVFLNPQGRLIVTGPDVADTAILDPSTGGLIADTQDLPEYPGDAYDDGRREWAAATLLPSGPAGPTTILMTGGSPASGDHYNDAPATNTALLIDVNTGAISPAPPNVRGRSHVNVTTLPDGTLFANGGGVGSAGGSLYAGPVTTGELRNPATGAWTETPPQAYNRTYHSTSLLLPDGRVMSAGDDRQQYSDNTGLRTLEYYSPPYLFRGARPVIGSAPAGAPYGVPVGVGTPTAGIAKAVLIKLGSRTHALDVDQRSLELPVAAVANGVQFTTPTNPNAAPPGYYMLFLVNGQGVPSVAKMLRLDTGLPAPSAIPAAGGGPGGGPAVAKRKAPKLSKLSATVSFRGKKAIVKIRFRASKAFRGTVKLYPPTPRAKRGKRVKVPRALATKKVAGPGGRKVGTVLRFSTRGKRFPLSLRLTVALRDKRGGLTRTTTKGLKLTKSPKPKAKILARAPRAGRR